MKVLIDGHMIGSHEGGNERYTKNLYLSLKKIADDDFSVTLFDRKMAGNDFQRLFKRIPGFISNNKINIVHTNYTLPFKKNCHFVTTIHDLSFKVFPHIFSLKDQLIFKLLLPISLKMSDAVIVPSNFTRQEFIRFYPQYQDKIYLVGEGIDPVFVRKRITKKNFILAFNSKSPRKNINRLIKGFLLFEKRFPNLYLYLVGGQKNIDKKLLLNKKIKILGSVSDKKLVVLFNQCRIFINYSLYEGFDLTALEAIKCQAQVILSDIPVHREITLNKLTYINPFDYNKLTEAIIKKLNKKTISKNEIVDYEEIVKKSNWLKSAREMIKIYKKVNSK
jgi:glycosyltransferase involved in cell wall biosynthesis